MEESTRWRSHLGEGGGYARKIPTSVYRFKYSFSPLFSFLWSFGDERWVNWYLLYDLFSRFEQQISFLEKQAEATDPTMDRHGHDGPSQGLVSKHLEKLKIGYWNRLSELRNGMAGRTVTGVTDRHRPFSTRVLYWPLLLCSLLCYLWSAANVPSSSTQQ